MNLISNKNMLLISHSYFVVLTVSLLITTIVVFNLFYLSIKSQLLGMKLVFKHKDQINFQPHEVVDRDSETQLQVGENLNTLF